jgi:acetyl-CoA carboxylase carboxyl transferase subunit beta
MSSNKKLEHGCELNKSMSSFGPVGYTSENEDPILNDTDKKIANWSDSAISNVYYLFDIRDIWSLIFDDTFLVRDSNGDSYSVYLDIENSIFEIENSSSFSNYLNSSCLNSGSKGKNRYYYHYMHDSQSSWNTHINSCIDSYLRFEIGIDSYISGGTDNYSESDNALDINNKYRHLWVQCENCYGLNYKKFFRSKMNICEQCGYHLKMSSSDRIELLIDPGTWDPMNEDVVSMDPIEFDSEEEPQRRNLIKIVSILIKERPV